MSDSTDSVIESYQDAQDTQAERERLENHVPLSIVVPVSGPEVVGSDDEESLMSTQPQYSPLSSLGEEDRSLSPILFDDVMDEILEVPEARVPEDMDFEIIHDAQDTPVERERLRMSFERGGNRRPTLKRQVSRDVFASSEDEAENDPEETFVYSLTESWQRPTRTPPMDLSFEEVRNAHGDWFPGMNNTTVSEGEIGRLLTPPCQLEQENEEMSSQAGPSGIQYGGGSSRRNTRRRRDPIDEMADELEEVDEMADDVEEFDPNEPGPSSRWPSASQRNDPTSNSQSQRTSSLLPPPRKARCTHFPTDEELRYFEKYSVTDQNPRFLKLSTSIASLPHLRFRFRNLDQLPETVKLEDHIGKVFDIFIRKMIKDAGGNLKSSHFWLNMAHPGYREKSGFWIRHETYQTADGHELLNIISKHAQSNNALHIDETMYITMHVFRLEKGAKAGRGPQSAISEEILKYFGIKRAVVLGKTHCMAKAVVIGKRHADYEMEKDPTEKTKLQNLCRQLMRLDVKSTEKSQLEAAKSLLRDAGMDEDQPEHTLGHLEELAHHLIDYEISLYEEVPNTAIPQRTNMFNRGGIKGHIALFFHNDHYEYYKPTLSRNNEKYCPRCREHGGQDHWNFCKALCNRCGREGCNAVLGGKSILCAECNIYFYSKECYDSHKASVSRKADPYCKKYVKCPDCRLPIVRWQSNIRLHVCHATKYCGKCGRFTTAQHECSFQLPTEKDKEKSKKKQERYTMVTYDFESIVVDSEVYKENASDGITHRVNHVSYRLICDKCLGQKCPHCGPLGRFSYQDGASESVVERFANFLMVDPRLTNAYVIAHNGGRYDHIFLIKLLAKKANKEPQFVANGSSILNATVEISPKNTLTFRDSLLFIPMRLADMPKAFGLPIESKGYFPYLKNHEGNYGQKWSSLPKIEEYEPKFMSEKSRAVFEQWYEEHKHQPFDFDEELVKYCDIDVEILTAAVCVYMQLCQSLFKGWNPFIQASTIASYIMFVLTNEYIPERTVGNVPENGFKVRNNSKLALKYIRWMEKMDDRTLKHALSGGEHQVVTKDGKKYFLDAYDEKTKEVFEINGCYWHGCKFCYSRRDDPHPEDPHATFGSLWERTKKKREDLRAEGYKVHSIWECTIKDLLKKNKRMAKFFKKCRHVHQLRPRDGMYGGRTQAFRTFAEACARFSLNYLDYCSVYPYMNMKGTQYPIGQPVRITENFDPVNLSTLTYRGMVYCDVLPPTDLDLPVLPQRYDGKLIFPLCDTCATEKNDEECNHEDEDRVLTGVWCTDELQLALDKGYKIVRFFEVWNWTADKWFRGGFFAAFMKPLLKKKHEASGWPRPGMSESEKDEFVKKVKEQDGVDLDPKEMDTKNPALRSLAKLFLNSTWGKFAQKPGKTETKLIRTTDDGSISSFFDESGYEPKKFLIWDEENVLVARKKTEAAVETTRFTNVVYGALTTSAARIHLYKALDAVGDGRVYCDTDSVIFLQPRDKDLLKDKKGDCLGMMTDEIPAGSELIEVVTVAPKVYGLKIRNNTTNEISYQVKAKGITLNSTTAEKINFESMKRMMTDLVDNNDVEPLVAQRFAFKRGPLLFDDITTVHQEKRMRPVVDKGRFTEEGNFQPFGYRNGN